MERRCEPRIEAYQTVELVLLGDDADTIEAHATQFSGSGLRLVLKEPVAVGTAVKVQGDDWLMLGEVCYCQRDRFNFVVGLQLEHSLTGLRQLEQLNRKFRVEEMEPAGSRELFLLDVVH